MGKSKKIVEECLLAREIMEKFPFMDQRHDRLELWKELTGKCEKSLYIRFIKEGISAVCRPKINLSEPGVIVMANPINLSEMASLGGKAAAAKMTPEQRKERASNAAAKRWKNPRKKEMNFEEKFKLRTKLEACREIIRDMNREIVALQASCDHEEIENPSVDGLPMNFGVCSICGKHVENAINGHEMLEDMLERNRQSLVKKP